MNCPNCGTTTPPGAAFCDNCGTPLSAAAGPPSGRPATPVGGRPTCPSCGENVVPGQAFCDNCGAALEQAQAAPTVAASEFEQSAPSNRCPSCGAATMAGMAFCDNCGAALGEQAPPQRPGWEEPTAPDYSPAPGYGRGQEHGPPPQRREQPPEAHDYERQGWQEQQAPPPQAAQPGQAGQPWQAPPAPSPQPQIEEPYAERGPVEPAPAEQRTPLRSRLVIQASNAALPFPPDADELIIGREDAVSGHFPEVDLSPHGGEEGGVSRRHARVTRQGERYLIEDLNSVNYTFVNRQKLQPGQRQLLNPGDELRFGRVVARFESG